MQNVCTKKVVVLPDLFRGIGT